MDAIRGVVLDTLKEFEISTGKIFIKDKGASGLCNTGPYGDCTEKRGRCKRMRRTMLFLPGNTPNMLINGDTLGADTVIFDLEDAVSPDEKDAARILVRNALKIPVFRWM